MVSSLPAELWDPLPDDTFQPSLSTVALESWFRDRGLGSAVAVIQGP